MVTAERRQKQIRFHNVDLYNSIQIPVRDYLLELTQDLELAVLLNQMIFSKKEYMTLNDIKRLSLNEKTKQTIRTKLEQLIELGLIKKYKSNVDYNLYLYTPADIISDNQDILGLIEGSDLKFGYNYLSAMILNKFKTYAISGITEIRMSARQLKSMLGVNSCLNTIRKCIKNLERDNFISGKIEYGVYNYTFNLDKLKNNYTYSYEELENYNLILSLLYTRYVETYGNDYFKKHHTLSFKTNTKKQFEKAVKKLFLKNTKYDPNVLIYIMYYLLFYSNFKDDFKTFKDIIKEYDQLADLSLELSKRKVKRFIYKLRNNLLPKTQEQKKEQDKIYWDKAREMVEKCSGLYNWYVKSLKGVHNVDFEDYRQEALKIAYELLKKNEGFTFRDDNISNFFNQLKFKLMDFMYDERTKVEVNNTVVNADYQNIDFDSVDLEVYRLYQSNDQNKPVEIDFDTNTGINKLFDILDDKSRFIIKHHIGYDGHSLTFKEIGNKLNISEGHTSRLYNKAIRLLRHHFPPDKEQEIRQLIFNT